MTGFRQSILSVAEICARHNLSDVILSPGSRSAPLTLGFLRHPDITCRTIVDERSAAFVAMGLAQQKQAPVAIVCTSGTAALNYAPAVAEAYYQQIPLLVLTADRPPEWLTQDDGQTIIQNRLYEPHCNASFELPIDDSHPDVEWHISRIMSEAINRSTWPKAGPVHVNVPLREPLYPDSAFNYPKETRIVNVAQTELDLTEEQWQRLIEDWRTARRRLIIAGLHPHDDKVNTSLKQLEKEGAVILADITSNCNDGRLFRLFDMILGKEHAAKEVPGPDLLITFGGPVVSKNLKFYLRQCQPEKHWSIRGLSSWPDPFQSVREIIPVQAAAFFTRLVEKTERAVSSTENSYDKPWFRLEKAAHAALRSFLQSAGHCELTVMAEILRCLPEQSNLHLGNSSIVRLANLIMADELTTIRVNSNRGTCGIDGTLSTAVGAALAHSHPTILITGDLAFFYDRNGLWHSYLPENLKIIVLNNGGGGIFRLLEGSQDLPELQQHFEVEHNLTARNVASDHGLDYQFCSSAETLGAELDRFLQPNQRAAILEIAFDKNINAAMFRRFKSILKEIQ